MKKFVLLTILSLSVGTLFAQLQEKLGVKTVIGASAVQKDNLNLILTQTRSGVSGTFQIKSTGVQVGLPYMGTGRNLSYKKDLFQSFNGFEKSKKAE